MGETELEQLEIHLGRTEPWSLPHATHEVNEKRITDVNAGTKIIKLFKENIGRIMPVIVKDRYAKISRALGFVDRCFGLFKKTGFWFVCFGDRGKGFSSYFAVR